MSRKIVSVLFLVLPLVSWLVRPTVADGKMVALFPVKLISPKPAPYLVQGIKTMFVSRLSEVGLEVTTDEAFAQYLNKEEKKGKITRDRAQQVASRINAQYAIFGTLTAIGKGLSLDLSLLDLTKNPPKLTRVSEATTEDEFIPRLAEIANRFRELIEGSYTSPVLAAQPRAQGPGAPRGPFYQLGTGDLMTGKGNQGLFISTVPKTGGPEPSGRALVRTELVAMDADDLDGDNNPELALLSRNELRIYSRAGKTLKLLDTLKAPGGEDFVKVSMADVDGNGRPEIYVTVYRLNGIKTDVYEWDGHLRRLFSKSGHLVAVKSPGRKLPYLLYQNTHPIHLFTGRISIMEYAGPRKLVKKITLPRILNTRFYTITPYDINKDGSPEILGLGDGNSLHIWNLSGGELWNENETIGGNNNAIDLQNKNPDPNMPRIEFNPRLVIDDINGDGKKEVVAVYNIPIIGEFEHFKFYDSGYLLGYKFKGAKLQRAWKTAKMRYCIVDIQSYNHTLFLALQKFRMKNYGKGYSRVLWFDLPKKK